jgi:hypothetical protein
MLMIIMAGTFASSFGRQEYVVAKEENTAVYQNRGRNLYERKLFNLNPDEKVRVLEKKGEFIKVENRKQQCGWVEEHRVVPIAASRIFTYDHTDVMGYLDNPEPIIILDATDPDDNVIRLDRSFKDALRENVDRETVMCRATR